MDFSTLFALGEKDAVLRDMISSMKGLFTASEERRKYSTKWQTLAKRLSAILISQVPDAKSQAESLSESLNKIADAELSLSTAEGRAAEDFRDIIERYEVLFRTNEEYLQAKSQYEDAAVASKKAVDADIAGSTKPTYVEKTKYTLQANMTRTKDLQKRALETFKEKATAMIDARNRYTAFKIRRLTHGWILYGTTLKQTAETEIETMTSIKGILVDFRAKGGNEETIAQAEVEIQKQIQEAPRGEEEEEQHEAVPVFPVEE
jgi:tetratricopeptide (TPR) repeat protein